MPQSSETQTTSTAAGLRINELTAYRVIVAGNALARRATAHFRQYLNVTMWEARIVGWLGSYPGISLKDLAERTMLDKGQLSRVVSELTSQGLVERRVVGRSISLSLTPEGEREYRRFVDLTERHEREYTEGFDPHELEILHDLLDRLIARAHQLSAEEALPDPDE